MLSIKLALAYFRRRKLRAILTTLSVAAAIAVMVALQGLNGSIDYASREIAALLVGKAQLVVKAPQGGLSDSLLAVVQKTAGVQAAVPFVQNTAQFKELPGFTTVIGFEPGEDEKILTYQVIQGRLPAEDRREIAVPRELLQGIHDYRLGDTWHIQTIEGMQDFSLVGILDDSVGVQADNSAVVLMPMTTAQKSFGLEGRLSYISVVLQHPDNVLSVQKALQESIGNSGDVHKPTGQNNNIDKILLHMMSMNNVYGFMGLFLALYVMYNSMRVAVTEQQSQIGILRTLGWRQREIHRLIQAQAIIIGMIGSSLGLFLGVFLAQALLNTVSNYLNEMFKISITHPHFTTLNLSVIWLTGVLSCLISAWLPARKAAGIAPIKAINSNFSYIKQSCARRRVVIGTILMITSWTIMIYRGNTPLLFQAALTGIVIGSAGLMPPILILFLKGLEPLAEKIFGLPGRLGVSSFRRNSKRIVSTGMPILLGLAFAFGCLNVYAGLNLTIDKYVKAIISSDIVINQGIKTASMTQIGLPENILDRVRKEDGVRGAAGIRVTGIQWQGNPVDIQAYDVAEWRQFTNPPVVEPGLEQALSALQKGGKIWISQAMALKYGLNVGQKLTIPTPAGLIEFPVGAIIKDISTLNGVVYMNRQDLIRYWGDNSIDYVFLSLEPGISPLLVRDRLNTDLKNDFKVRVMLSSDYRNSLLKMTSSVTNIFNLVILVVLLVAAVGTANSMLISVLERVREINTLRSVGLTRRQIASMFLIEVGCLFIAGILLSIPVAVSIHIFGNIFFKNVFGWVLDVSIPWANDISVAVAMALVVTMSALYPAWLASKADRSAFGVKG